MAVLDPVRYPIGGFTRPEPLAAPQRAELIASVAALPAIMRGLVSPLSDVECETRYRPGGWTVRQLVHHVPDSHLNAYIRMKLALTEEMPAVMPYHEELWAELPDKALPPSVSLDLLDALHRRWVALLRALPESDFQRAFAHPDWGRATLDDTLALYEWHGRHHAAHIRLAIEALRVPPKA